MNTTLLAIDVGSKELVTARRGTSSSSPLLKTYAITPAGRRQLLESLRPSLGSEHSIRACLEATGAYSLEIAVLLATMPGCEVMVSNPMIIKSFLRARGFRAKTDRMDALGILTFLETMAGPRLDWSRVDVSLSGGELFPARLRTRDIAKVDAGECFVDSDPDTQHPNNLSHP